MNTTPQKIGTISLDKIYSGRVKWFNKRLGYGFIEFKNEEGVTTNIFGHYSKIKPVVTTYKTLFQGEYVSFNIESSKRADMEYQAYDITGIDGGYLMADTQEKRRSTSNEFEKPGPSHIDEAY